MEDSILYQKGDQRNDNRQYEFRDCSEATTRALISYLKILIAF